MPHRVAAFEIAGRYRQGHDTLRNITARASLVRNASGVNWAAEASPPSSTTECIGYFEDALESGIRAADEVIKALR